MKQKLQKSAGNFTSGLVDQVLSDPKSRKAIEDLGVIIIKRALQEFLEENTDISGFNLFGGISSFFSREEKK